MWFRKLISMFFVLISMPNILRSEKANICLTMIVKNEEKIIERCLNSVVDVIDCVSICDTGSTDNTVAVIEAYLKKHNLKGKVHQQEWKNFGHNRTLSVQSAQELLNKLEFPMEQTYLLLLDADMLLVKEPNFSKENLKADSYLLCQKNHSQAYYNTRLIRASLPWKCVGVTHEYWSCQAPCKEERLTTLIIDDKNDGGCKSDKFERDIRLLTQGLKDEPNNERYMFYLAQSYRCLHLYDDAIKWYKERIARGGWKEEVWYSKFMIAECYKENGQWDQAMQWYLDAYNYNPARAEPLQQLSSHFRYSEQYELATLFAKKGKAIPYPCDHNLFITYPVYDYLFDVDLSIAAFYTAEKEEGFASANKLMLQKGIPDYIKDQACKNILFYAPKLKNAQYKPIELELPVVREGLASRFNPMNPTIHKTKDGYEVICRTVNYLQIGAKHYKSLDLNDPTIRTRNFLVQYDKDLKLLSQQEIVDNLPHEGKKRCNIVGLEDCRVFEYKNSTWFTCTTLDTSPTGQPQISVCKLSDDRSGPTVAVEKLFPILGPDPMRCEKNWMPVINQDDIQVIYSYDPFIIYKPNLEEKHLALSKENEVLKYEPKHDFSRFSGSAPPIAFDDGYLMLVHETVYNDQRHYLHRLVYMDPNFNIVKMTRPFVFMHYGVEYCCGITTDHADKNLLLTIGIEDHEAYICQVDLATVKELLEPLP